ncbi:MAG: glycosyltransferase family 1 protein [Planctomycetota bacterium]
MRIAFDVGNIDIRNGGVAPYAERLLTAFQDYPDSSFNITMVKGECPVAMPKRRSWRRRRKSTTDWEKDSRVWKHFDVYHSPSQIVRSQDIPWIVTMHDVQELHFPEYFSSADREFRAVYHRQVIENANAVVVSFDHVREDLIRFFDIPGERIHTIPLPMSYCGLPEVDEHETLQTRKRLGLPERYVVYPAQTWPHKNHIGLLKALLELRERGNRIDLICTGHVNDFFDDSLRPFIEEHAMQDQVHMLGSLSTEDLAVAYKSSRALVIPTKYEAGSFPLIEAMLMRQPVICARTTSLPATIESEEFVFDADDSSAMANLIEKIVDDSDFRDRSISNSVSVTKDWHSINIAERYHKLWNYVFGSS